MFVIWAVAFADFLIITNSTKEKYWVHFYALRLHTISVHNLYYKAEIDFLRWAQHCLIQNFLKSCPISDISHVIDKGKPCKGLEEECVLYTFMNCHINSVYIIMVCKILG